MFKTSASKIEIANHCLMRAWLIGVEKEKPERIPPYEKGGLLHNLIENFWKKLGSIEEVAKSSSPKKYSNAKEFAKYAQGRWMRRVIGAEKSGKPISWRFENQKFVIKYQLENICRTLFPLLVEEGEPLFSELKFRFIFEDKEFTGRIDEVRKKNEKIIIRDYKSGKPWLDNMKVNHHPQLTLYNVGLCAKCCSDDEVAEKLDLLEERKRFMGNPIYVYPNFHQEFFMIEAPSVIDLIDKNPGEYKKLTRPEIYLPSIRRDEHFFEIVNMVDRIKEALSNGDINPERGNKCDFCDVKKPCEDRIDKVNRGLTDKTGQRFFSIATPLYAKEKYDKKKRDTNQKTFRFKFK